MATSKVIKIKLIGLKSVQDSFLEEIQKKDILQIIETKSAKNTLNDDYLRKIQVILSSLESRVEESFFEKNKIQYVTSDFFFEEQKNNLEKSKNDIDAIYNKLSEITSLNKEKEALKTQLQEIEPWKYFSTPFSNLNQSNYYQTFLIKITNAQLESLSSSDFSTSIDYSILNKHQKNADFKACMFIVPNSFVDQFLQHIKSADIEIFIPQEKTFSLEKVFTNTTLDIVNINKKIASLNSDIDNYTKSLDKMRLLYDYFQNLAERDFQSQQITETDFIFHTDAFIAEKNIPILKKTIQKIDNFIDFETISLEEGEELPVLIDNKGFAQNFEFVTGMYSMPSHDDPDPTPFLAPFFAIFMGMCIGDTGYGAVLALVSFFAIKKVRLDKSMKQLFSISFFAGLTSIIAGMVTGSYFAIPFDTFGVHIPKLYSPSENIMLALGVAVSFGFIHITLAFIIKTLFLWSKGRFIDGLLDGCSRIAVMIGSLLLVLSFLLHQPQLLVIGKNTLISASLIILFTGGRHDGTTLVSKFMWGFYEVYSLTGIFGDLLSYARLFALALSGGIIGTALNTLTPGLISDISFHSIGDSIVSVILILVCAIILIIGHMFVMILSILSGFVHTMRLQFVEFFTKFFSGGGVAFKSFGIKLNYYWIKKINK